jgi:hypothetical protein
VDLFKAIDKSMVAIVKVQWWRSAGCICFTLQQFCTCMVTHLKKRLQKEKNAILEEIGRIDFVLESHCLPFLLG